MAVNLPTIYTGNTGIRSDHRTPCAVARRQPRSGCRVQARCQVLIAGAGARLLGDALCLPGGIAVILKALRVSVLGTLRPRRHLRVTDPIRCAHTRTVRSWIRHHIHPLPPI